MENNPDLKQMTVMYLVPSELIEGIKKNQNEIAEKLQRLSEKLEKHNSELPQDYITALQFRKAVHIGQWKFDQLVNSNLIKTIKKKRKIYVPATEVQRFFSDPSIR